MRGGKSDLSFVHIEQIAEFESLTVSLAAVLIVSIFTAVFIELAQLDHVLLL